MKRKPKYRMGQVMSVRSFYGGFAPGQTGPGFEGRGGWRHGWAFGKIVALREQNEQLLEALTGCREMLNQFVEHFEEKFDLSDDTTEELLEAFDEGGGYGRNDENFRLTAQGRKYRDLADAAISAVKGKP